MSGWSADEADPADGAPAPGRTSGGGQPTPHDSLFRQVFGAPANVASQLRAVLPPALAARLDLGGLSPVPASFVDEALKWRHSDLLFTAPLDGRDAFVYVLVEHQSRADPLMAFRMLRYVTRIWDRHLREHPEARRLPAVIPLVVHHGRSRWTPPVQLLDLIDLDPAASQAMRSYLPRFEFLLDDLADIDAARLRARRLTPSALITLLLLKIAVGNPRITTELRPWFAELREVLDQPGGGDTFTTADMLRAEGRVEGEARASAKMLEMVLTVKFGPLPDSVVKAVHAASVDQLEAWTPRAVIAETLDEAIGKPADTDHH